MIEGGSTAGSEHPVAPGQLNPNLADGRGAPDSSVDERTPHDG
jgi:hypothetical protein